MIEWGYNTNYHSRAKTTPFKVLYGYYPPIYLPYISEDSRNEVMDKLLKDREEKLNILRFHLHRARETTGKQTSE